MGKVPGTALDFRGLFLYSQTLDPSGVLQVQGTLSSAAKQSQCALPTIKLSTLALCLRTRIWSCSSPRQEGREPASLQEEFLLASPAAPGSAHPGRAASGSQAKAPGGAAPAAAVTQPCTHCTPLHPTAPGLRLLPTGERLPTAFCRRLRQAEVLETSGNASSEA